MKNIATLIYISALVFTVYINAAVAGNSQPAQDGHNATVYDGAKEYKEEAAENDAGKKTTRSSFAETDINKDKHVSVIEAENKGLLQETYTKLDVNGDGQLDESEFSSFEETGSNTTNSE